MSLAAALSRRFILIYEKAIKIIITRLYRKNLKRNKVGSPCGMWQVTCVWAAILPLYMYLMLKFVIFSPFIHSIA